jgi:hypothetical protein
MGDTTMNTPEPQPMEDRIRREIEHMKMMAEYHKDTIHSQPLTSPATTHAALQLPFIIERLIILENLMNPGPRLQWEPKIAGVSFDPLV